jgi:hypothetical protein
LLHDLPVERFVDAVWRHDDHRLYYNWYLWYCNAMAAKLGVPQSLEETLADSHCRPGNPSTVSSRDDHCTSTVTSRIRPVVRILSAKDAFRIPTGKV